MSLEEQTNGHKLDTMTSTQQDDYFREIERLLQEGWTDGQIQRHFGLHRQTARRHIARAKGRLEAGPSHMSSSVALLDYDPPMPLAITKKTHKTHRRQVPDLAAERLPFKGGRQTTMSGGGRLDQIVPPPEGGDWRLEDIAPDELRRMVPADLITRMIRISPEISRAYYDFLRMANPGHELKAVVPGTDTPHEQGQEWLNFFEKKMAVRNNRGSVDIVYNMMLANLWVRGALFCELVLAKDARTFMDMVVPDAYSARFKIVKDPDVGGNKFQLVQGTGRDAVVLDRDTVRYVPVDPLPDSPYGTSPVAPGLFPALFLITMLQDARRVVAQQGWPRLDIIIDIAQIIGLIPEKDRAKPEVVKAWVQKAVDDVAASYSELDPDQAWVHTNTVTFGTPIGAIGHLEGVDSLISVLERMAVRALKSQPLLFGMPEGVSEANANRQWEVHVQGVEALQNLCSETISYLFTLALEAEGVDAQAKFKFQQLRAIEDLRDAQATKQKLENSERMELLGYAGHDEASIYAVGHPAVKETTIGIVGDTPADNPTAGPVAGGLTGDDTDVTGDDGAALMVSMPQFRLLSRVFSDPDLSLAVTQAIRILSGRAVAKMEPKGEPANTGLEPLSVGRRDFRAARADFDYRVAKPYQGILDATLATDEA